MVADHCMANDDPGLPNLPSHRAASLPWKSGAYWLGLQTQRLAPPDVRLPREQCAELRRWERVRFPRRLFAAAHSGSLQS